MLSLIRIPFCATSCAAFSTAVFSVRRTAMRSSAARTAAESFAMACGGCGEEREGGRFVEKRGKLTLVAGRGTEGEGGREMPGRNQR